MTLKFCAHRRQELDVDKWTKSIRQWSRQSLAVTCSRSARYRRWLQNDRRVKLNHITLAVSNLARSRDFYTRLGLRLIVLEEPRYARFHVPASDSTLSIEVMSSPASPSVDGCHLYFECDDVDQMHSNLSAAGVDFIQAPTDMDYLWREARMRDPDGHDVRLYSAGRNRLYPPWRIWWTS